MPGHSSTAHRTFDLLSQCYGWDSADGWDGLAGDAVRTDGTGVVLNLRTQCPAERLATLGELEATGVGVQIDTSAWQPSSPVDDQLARNRYDPQEIELRRAIPTAHTRALRNVTKPNFRVYLARRYPTPPQLRGPRLPPRLT